MIYIQARINHEMGKRVTCGSFERAQEVVKELLLKRFETEIQPSDFISILMEMGAPLVALTIHGPEFNIRRGHLRQIYYPDKSVAYLVKDQGHHRFQTYRPQEIRALARACGWNRTGDPETFLEPLIDREIALDMVIYNDFLLREMAEPS